MFKLILTLHIAGALVLGILILTALINVWRNRLNKLKFYASNIGFGLGLQLATGSLLVLTENSRGAELVFCGKIGLYLAVVAATEGLLFYKIKSPQNFPVKIIAGSALIGAGFVIWAMIFGF